MDVTAPLKPRRPVTAGVFGGTCRRSTELPSASEAHDRARIVELEKEIEDVGVVISEMLAAEEEAERQAEEQEEQLVQSALEGGSRAGSSKWGSPSTTTTTTSRVTAASSRRSSTKPRIVSQAAKAQAALAAAAAASSSGKARRGKGASSSLPLALQVVELEARASQARTVAMALAGRAGEHLSLEPGAISAALLGLPASAAAAASASTAAPGLPRRQSSLRSGISSAGGSRTGASVSWSSAGGSGSPSPTEGSTSAASRFAELRSRLPSAVDLDPDRITGRRPRSGARQPPTLPTSFSFVARANPSRSIRQRKFDADMAAARAAEDAALAFRFIAQPAPPTTRPDFFREAHEAAAASRRAGHAQHFAALAAALHSFGGIDAHTLEHQRRLEAHRAAASAAAAAELTCASQFTAQPPPATTWRPDEAAMRMRELDASRAQRVREAAVASAAASALPPRMALAAAVDTKRADAAAAARRPRPPPPFVPHTLPNFEALHADFSARVHATRTARATTQPVAFGFEKRKAEAAEVQRHRRRRREETLRLRLQGQQQRPATAPSASSSSSSSSSSVPSSAPVQAALRRWGRGGALAPAPPAGVTGEAAAPPIEGQRPRSSGARPSPFSVVDWLAKCGDGGRAGSTHSTDLRVQATRRHLAELAAEKASKQEAEAAHAAAARAASARIAPLIASIAAQQRREPMAWEVADVLEVTTERRRQFAALSRQREQELAARLEEAQQALPLLMQRFAAEPAVPHERLVVAVARSAGGRRAWGSRVATLPTPPPPPPPPPPPARSPTSSSSSYPSGGGSAHTRGGEDDAFRREAELRVAEIVGEATQRSWGGGGGGGGTVDEIEGSFRTAASSSGGRRSGGSSGDMGVDFGGGSNSSRGGVVPLGTTNARANAIANDMNNVWVEDKY